MRYGVYNIYRNIYKKRRKQDLVTVRDFLGNPDYFVNDNINLLRITNNEDNSHYVYIKHVSRLFNLSSTKKDTDNYCPYCNKCFHSFDFSQHINTCYKIQFNEGSLIKLPQPPTNKKERDKTIMKFYNYKNKLERPFVVYMDCEASLIPMEIRDNEKNTKLLNKHVINSCCFYFVCSFDSSRNKLYDFRGSNCLSDMIKQLYEIANECIEEMRENKRMIMTLEDGRRHDSDNICHICNEEIYTCKENYKVRDHDHRTGAYRGPAHRKCIINYFANRYLPVVCHNLRGYDSHLIIEQIYQLYPNKDIQAIPNNYEKFMSFKIGELKFIDSFQFMASSIEKLTENLYTTDYKPILCEDKDKEYIDYLKICEPAEYNYLLKNKKNSINLIIKIYKIYEYELNLWRSYGTLM